jgi:membrane protease YdiL (CAAX protease family)
LKDALRLLVYLAATILVGALIAPLIFWAGQWLVGHGWFSFLAQYDFETFFHRALLIAAVLLLLPFFPAIRSMRDLDLEPNPRWWRDLGAGALLAAIPLLCCAAVFLGFNIYSVRHIFAWGGFSRTVLASIFVPMIEETFFRGIVLGIFLRSGWRYLSILVTSAIFAIVHFLKAPEQTSTIVTWHSGFDSLANSFWHFREPMLVAASFATLFLIGWILADARLRTKSLWLPLGLHAGWIFAGGSFNALARREITISPWLGKNLLVGIVPLGVAAVTWLIMHLWLRYDRHRKN